MKDVVIITGLALFAFLVIFYTPRIYTVGVLMDSMSPTYPSGSVVRVTKSLPIRVGDAATFTLHEGIAPEIKEGDVIIKRVTKIAGECYWVEGDNRAISLDSREFGWLCSEDYESKMRVL